MNATRDSSMTGASGSGWQRRYTIVALCTCAVFVCYIDRVNISVAVIAMQDEFGWSETTKGWVLSSFFIGYMLFMAPSGWIANRIGGKFVLGVAVLWWSVFTILTPGAAFISLPILIATRIAMGLGEAAMFPAAYNLYGRWIPADERSRAVALLVGGIPIGTLFALTATGWIVDRFGWPSVFYLFGAAGFIWCIAWFRLAHDDPAGDPHISAFERDMLRANTSDADAKEPIPWRTLASTPAVWALIVNHFCSNWGFYMLLAWLPSYFNDQLNLNIVHAGLYSAAPWLTMFVVGNLGGVVADKLTKSGMDLTTIRKTMQITGLLGSASFLLAAQDVQSANVGMGLMCGALGFLALTWSGFVPNHLDLAPRYADVLMGVTNTAGTIPGIIGVVITGWLVDTTGSYSSAFALCAGINLFGAVVWFLFASAKRVID